MTKATDFKLGEMEHVLDVCTPVRVENTAGEMLYEYTGYYDEEDPTACEFPASVLEMYVILMQVKRDALVITVTE